MNSKRLLIAIIGLFTSLTVIAAAKQPIVIGLNADMSAVAAEGGLAIQRGAQIAIDEINQSGGLLGRKVELQVRDHRGNPARGLSNIKKFAKQADVVAVLGGIHTPVVLHELEEIHQQKLLYLIPWAAGTPIVDNGYTPNYVFRLSVRDEHAGHVLMSHAKERKFDRVGLLLERTGWGRSNEKSMTAAANQLGITISGIEWFNWREITMKDQVARLKENGAQAILLVSNAPEGATIIKGLASMPVNERLPVLSHWGIAGGSFVKMAGLETIKKVDLNVLQTYSFLAPSDEQRMNNLLSAYQQQFDQAVTPESVPAAVGVVHAYDLVKLLAISIKQANSLDHNAVRVQLENIDSYAGVFKQFSYPFTTKKHDALTLKDYTITKYNGNGYLVPVQH